MNAVAPASRSAARRTRRDEALRRANVLLEVTRRCAALTDLNSVLAELVHLTSRELDCERGTLFLNDAQTGELYSRVAEGNLTREIRILNSSGVAGHVFRSGEPVCVNNPYEDPRFDRSVDDRTGFATRNIACVPLHAASGEIVGVMQSLNRRGGDFTEADLIGKPLADVLGEGSQWVLDQIVQTRTGDQSSFFPDASMAVGGLEKSLNVTFMPLRAADEQSLGAMLMFEDISNEKRMKSTMSRYMDPVIAAQMLEGDGLDLLGGVNTEATIMFTDVRGFTGITEESGAQGTVQFLNQYFTMMVDCISREGGMLDKFIGDAIMACFGLPIAHGDDPDRAARAAISMIRELWEWNVVRRGQGLKTVDMGIGLNTDNVVSGNIGSPKRMDYTVIGDGVNLASRLESACKAYSARILASESTVSRLRGTYRLRDVDLVVVKGKTQPVRVFEILDYHDAESFPNLMDVVNHFNEGMADYRGGKWDQAIARFTRCVELNPADSLSHTYIERCETLRASPPEGEWDGVWVMKSK